MWVHTLRLWSPCVLSEGHRQKRNDEDDDSDKHTEIESRRERGRRGGVAMEMTYGQQAHPIVVADEVIGFELKEGREVEEGPLVKRRVNELSLLSRIRPLNKWAMFALTHVCPVRHVSV